MKHALYTLLWMEWMGLFKPPFICSDLFVAFCFTAEE